MNCYTREQIEATMTLKGYKYFTGGDYDVNLDEVKGGTTNIVKIGVDFESIDKHCRRYVNHEIKRGSFPYGLTNDQYEFEVNECYFANDFEIPEIPKGEL